MVERKTNLTRKIPENGQTLAEREQEQFGLFKRRSDTRVEMTVENKKQNIINDKFD